MTVLDTPKTGIFDRITRICGFLAQRAPRTQRNSRQNDRKLVLSPRSLRLRANRCLPSMRLRSFAAKIFSTAIWCNLPQFTSVIREPNCAPRSSFSSFPSPILPRRLVRHSLGEIRSAAVPGCEFKHRPGAPSEERRRDAVATRRRGRPRYSHFPPIHISKNKAPGTQAPHMP